MQIRQHFRRYIVNETRNRILKKTLKLPRLRHTQEKYNLLQKLKTMLLTFKRRGKTDG